MQVHNHFGLPVGDTEAPLLVTHPRQGIPAVIDTPHALTTAAHALASGSTPVAIDVERAQGFRYGNDPYLVQIRREDVGTFLVDTHALPDLSILRDGVADVWLLHDAEQDLPNLRYVGLDTTQLFDTEIGARLLGLTHFGLAAVCEQILGLTVAKDHQASDWSVRPLPQDWLRYAALDVEMLSELYRRMGLELDALGRWDWAMQECDAAVRHPAPQPKKDRWRHLTGVSRLPSKRALGVLRELWETREALAKQLNIAPGRLVRNSALARASMNPPKNRRALLAIGEFRSPMAREHTESWLRAIRRALLLEDDELPALKPARTPGQIPNVRAWPKADPEAFERLTVVREAVSLVAEPLGLADDVVLEPQAQRYLTWAPLDPHASLDHVVVERLTHAGARPWQQELMVPALVKALSSQR